MLTRRSAFFLWLGDAVLLAAFVLLGMGTHATLAGPSALARFTAFAAPLLGAWTLAAAGLGALQFLPPLRWRVIWGRTLAAWLIAAPLALLARALLLGADTVVVAFASSPSPSAAACLSSGAACSSGSPMAVCGPHVPEA